MGNQSFHFRSFIVGFMILTVIAFAEGDNEANPSEDSPTSTYRRDDNLPTPIPPYRRSDIGSARFPQTERLSEALKKAKTFKQEADAKIVGQGEATSALQAKLIQYLGGFGTRDREPVMVNLAGLHGIGKTVLLDQLKNLGIRVVHWDAQSYIKDSVEDFGGQILNNGYGEHDEPWVLIVDEIDKVVESAEKGKEGAYFLGQLSRLVSEGMIVRGPDVSHLHNVLLVTTMNIDQMMLQEWLESQSSQSEGKRKTIYDVTTSDLRQFHEWVNGKGKHEALARSLLSQMVRRFVANSIIMKPLDDEDYRAIITKNINNAYWRSTWLYGNDARRISMKYSPGFTDFLARHSIVPITGAGETVITVTNLMDQLLTFGRFLSPSGDKSLDQPREIFLDSTDDPNMVRITVTPLLRGGGSSSRGPSFATNIKFLPGANSFETPEHLKMEPPPYFPSEPATPRVTNKVVREWRFPSGRGTALNIALEVNKVLVGQETLANILESGINNYLAEEPNAEGKGHMKILAGFTGVGKSLGVEAAAAAAGLPIIKLNLQSFNDKPGEFMKVLSDQVSEAGDKYILLLEEIDKVAERDAQYHFPLQPPPPLLGIIKEILDRKRAVHSETIRGNVTTAINVDLRNAYIVGTMNFGGESFGFQADPRLTSFEDLFKVWKQLQNRTELESQLGKLFLPDTINRMLEKIYVVPPLKEKAHQVIIERAAKLHVAEIRLGGEAASTLDNPSRVRLVLTPQYKAYLFKESAVPSLGGRNTFDTAANYLRRDLGLALENLPRSGGKGTEPLTITLHYLPGSQTVVSYRESEQEGEKQVLNKTQVILKYPSLEQKKPTAERLRFALHEFGHAITRVLFEGRFKWVIAGDILPGAGGFVSPQNKEESGESRIARILAVLGGRALERVLLGHADGSDNDTSARKTGDGAGNDLEKATAYLHQYLFELGQEPAAGVGSRSGQKDGMPVNPAKDVQHGALSAEEGNAEQAILKKLETHLVEILRRSFNKDWYAERIAALAQKGVMTETEFYQLIGAKHHPGEVEHEFTTFPALEDLFQGIVQPPPKEARKAQAEKLGALKATRAQLVAGAVKQMETAVQTYLVPLLKKPYAADCGKTLSEATSGAEL